MKSFIYPFLLHACLAITFPVICRAQQSSGLLLKSYRPVSIYNTPISAISHAAWPVTDMHSHDYAGTQQEIDEWVKTMDSMGIKRTVLLTFQTGKGFDSVVTKYNRYPSRFALWCGFDYTGFDSPGWQNRAIAELERCHRLGAGGIGELGDKGEGELYSKPTPGKGIHIDDPLLQPLLRKCGELNMPVSIHIGEDRWMYENPDSTNDGMMNAAIWHVDMHKPGKLSHAQLLVSLENALRQNPHTTFIACHLGNCCSDLSLLGSLLDKYPNLYADIAARYGEIAPVPRYTADFITRYQDRLVFGTDMGMDKNMYQVVFRILESADEHFYEIHQFNYHWPLYGLYLPKDILRKLYATNAEKILFSTPSSSTSPVTTLQNKNLQISINDHLQTQITSLAPGASSLMDGFSWSEYLETKYYTAKDFILVKKEQSAIHDAAGSGIEYKFYGRNDQYRLEKILTIRLYDSFPGSAWYSLSYVNHSPRDITVTKWVNHHYTVLPSSDSPRFWSFQGSSHSDRRDWIQKINPGFAGLNYMGMNASDYGGGIPLIDLWRKDAGIAIGLSAETAKTVSLPIDYDKYAAGASMDIRYEFAGTTSLSTGNASSPGTPLSPGAHTLSPGDTLRTDETFVSVHQKDCFPTLRTYGAYMQTKGIRPAPSEPAAFEPVWCAWGYERNFTLAEILNTLPKVKELGIKWVGLDDGFQQAEGDWHTNKQHFPGGDAEMKSFVDSIHARGMKAVIWWAPLAVDPGSALLKKDSNILLIRKDGSPQFITWWNAYYISPTDPSAIEDMKQTVKLFLQDWGFDALKLDGQHMNACAPDYADGHAISSPEQSFERMPLFFKTLFETARAIKPNAVVEFCPCGDCMNFYHMPYTNQFVASDPANSWQVRLKGKVYKALMPGTAYFGDHVELTDGKADFASQLGVGAVPGTKFVWPATGVSSKDENYLSPSKESMFKKYLTLYQEKMLSKGNYRGDLYDIGYDLPETHCIQKDGKMYYAFYAPEFSGTIELRGLQPDSTYRILDYYNNKELGRVRGNKTSLPVTFKQFLLIEAEAITRRPTRSSPADATTRR